MYKFGMITIDLLNGVETLYSPSSCLCARGYEGLFCDRKQKQVIISFHSDLRISDVIRVHLITDAVTLSDGYTQLFLRIPFDQTSVSFYTKIRFNYVWVTLWSDDHYLIFYDDPKISLGAAFNATQ